MTSNRFNIEYDSCANFLAKFAEGEGEKEEEVILHWGIFFGKVLDVEPNLVNVIIVRRRRRRLNLKTIPTSL